MSNKSERLKKLSEQYGLTGEDFFKHKKHGFIIVTRTGVEKIKSAAGIEVDFDVIPELSDGQSECTIKATGKMVHETKGELMEQSFGTANEYNCPVKTTRNGEPLPHYPVETAEKRALARVVLKLTEFYSHGVYSEDESDDFKK